MPAAFVVFAQGLNIKAMFPQTMAIGRESISPARNLLRCHTLRTRQNQRANCLGGLARYGEGRRAVITDNADFFLANLSWLRLLGTGTVFLRRPSILGFIAGTSRVEALSFFAARHWACTNAAAQASASTSRMRVARPTLNMGNLPALRSRYAVVRLVRYLAQKSWIVRNVCVMWQKPLFDPA